MNNRTPAERRYDAERDGAIYTKPEPASDDQIEREIAEECDRVIADHRAADDSFGADENIDEIITLLETIESRRASS